MGGGEMQAGAESEQFRKRVCHSSVDMEFGGNLDNVADKLGDGTAE
jgi:hypothetical protein